MQTKPNKMNAGKPFRLIDFKTFDATLSEVKYGVPSSGSDSSTDGRPAEKEPNLFMIQMFGINEQGQTCSITVHDFSPFFFVKVGDNWTQAHANAFVQNMCITNKMPWLQKQIISATIVEYHKLYGFSAGKKDRFVQIVFKNQNAFNRLKGLWYRKDANGNRRLIRVPFAETHTQIYESNIPPLLRYFHLKNVSPSGWVNVLFNRAHKTSPQTTSCTYEYVASQKHIVAIPEKETRVPYKIMSFDIEASSSHGDFPMPQKTYKKLAQSLVDAFLKNFVDPKTAHPATVASLIRRIISAAFGHAEFDDVDLVYPKKPPTKERHLNTIELMLRTPFEQLDSNGSDEDGEDRKRLLTIGAIFDKLRQGESGNGQDGDDSDADEAPETEECEHDDDESRGVYYRSEIRVERTCTVVDLMISDKYTRDAKITRIDEALTILFPPLKGDEVTFVGSTFMRVGEKEPYLNHCFAVGDCDPVDGAVIETATTEREMLTRWTELVCRENPDIIIGYNIFGFDYEFMFRRAMETGCERAFLQLSRRLGEMCIKESFAREGEREPPLDIEHTTIALASGDYDLKYIKMSGRLQVDMYMYLRREYNFGSYKLDDMASYFISDEIKLVGVVHDMTDGGVETHLYSKNLMGLHVGDFIHIEITSFTSDYYAGGQKFVVKDILLNQPLDPLDRASPMSNVVVIEGDHSALNSHKNIKWGMAKDDVSPQDIFRLSKGTAAEKARVAKYCIQDCNLVHHLLNKVDVLTGYVEMSSICSVPISFLVFRGQGIKLTSYVAKKCRAKDTLMPDLEKSGANEGYEGAIVLPPKCSMYMDNPVACVDYASLYPSSMISQNFSHDSKVWTKEYDLEGNLIGETGEKDKDGLYKYDNLPEFQYIDIEFDTFRYVRKTPTSAAVKTKCGKKVCRWAQFPDKKGIMPSILEELLKARSDTRKKAKTEPDPFMQNVLDKRQLGYKVTANSLYGQCGAKTSTFYEKDVAASTTATGRMMIVYARRIIEEVYGDYQYDTKCHGPVLTKAEYVYGDSVASYTPVYVRSGEDFDICTIESLAQKYGTVRGWAKCEEPGKQTKEFCEMRPGVETWTEKGWTKLHRVIRHALASHKKMVRVLTHTGVVDVTDDHSLLREDGTEISPKEVSVGDLLLHSSLPFEYWKQGGDIIHSKLFDTQLEAAVAVAQCPHVVAIVETVFGYKTTYCVINKSPVCGQSTNAIQSIREIAYEGHVYDLTTENHHFAAGIGNLIVHNTDSVFFTFNLEDPKTGEKVRGPKALEMTIEIAQDAAALCTRFLKPPMELSYEKTLMPFILLKKKRYVGMLYETDPKKGKLKYMGLSIKRRDSCDYLKDVYGGILNILMKENNIMKSIDFLNRCLEELVKGQVPMDKLTITRALSSYYKNPQTIAHRVLADRIGKRDPGNKPKPGDRLKFVFFENPSAKLQGDKIELPEYIVENGLKIDYAHYIVRQLMKPMQQLYGLGLEQIWEHQKKPLAVRTHKKEVEELRKKFPDQETFAKKHDDFCSKKVRPLLFDKWLNQLQNQRNNLQDISTFFVKR